MLLSINGLFQEIDFKKFDKKDISRPKLGTGQTVRVRVCIKIRFLRNTANP
jgi:hypothetical protein